MPYHNDVSTDWLTNKINAVTIFLLGDVTIDKIICFASLWIVYPNMKIMSSFIHSHVVQNNCMPFFLFFFCGAQKKIVLRMLVTVWVPL